MSNPSTPGPTGTPDMPPDGPEKPVGYVEVQRAWQRPQSEVSPREAMEGYISALQEAVTLSGVPMEAWGTRVERVEQNIVAYYGFVPKIPHPAEPLNPHNLNDAEQRALGQSTQDGTLGAKERKF